MFQTDWAIRQFIASDFLRYICSYQRNQCSYIIMIKVQLHILKMWNQFWCSNLIMQIHRPIHNFHSATNVDVFRLLHWFSMTVPTTRTDNAFSQYIAICGFEQRLPLATLSLSLSCINHNGVKLLLFVRICMCASGHAGMLVFILVSKVHKSAVVFGRTILHFFFQYVYPTDTTLASLTKKR